MLWLPQLLYLLHNSPISIQRKWFKKIDTQLRALIWKGRQPRIGLQTLQRPTQEEGLAVPHPRSYFLAAQLQHLVSDTDPEGNKNGGLMTVEAPHKTLVEVLEANSFAYRPPMVKLIIRVWKAIKDLREMGGYS